MRILEARESFLKIESEKNVNLASFLEVCDVDKSYVVQVIKTQKVGDNYILFAKILYLYNGSLENYDGTLPSVAAQIKPFNAKNILRTFIYNEPILSGKFVEGRENILLDKSVFDKKILICADTPAFLETVALNLKQELSKTSKVVVIDLQGVATAQKFVAGKDFRLPLNTESLEFLYEDCLNDVTSDSKTLIKDIFKDLSEYSKTISFLPFGALKSIVDDMVDNSHIFKLLALKNKLSKFDKMGYFAVNQAEAENLDKILAMRSVFLDLSKLDVIFQNRFFETIYKKLEADTQVIVIASNALTKKNLKTVLTKQNIASALITHPRFKFINEIKTMFKNFIIEPSFVSNEVFASYATFLNAMSKETYLLVGEGTNYLPVISVLEKFPENIVIETHTEEASISENNDEDVFEDIFVTDDADEEEDASEKDEQTKAIDKKSSELIEKISENINETPQDGMSLFDEDDSDGEESDTDDIRQDAEIVEDEPFIEEDGIVEVLNNFETEEEDDDVVSDDNGIVSVDTEQDFHTEVDEFQTIEVSDDILELSEEPESNSESYVETEQEVLEEVETTPEAMDEDITQGDEEEILADENFLDNPMVIEVSEEVDVDTLMSGKTDEIITEIQKSEQEELSEYNEIHQEETLEEVKVLEIDNDEFSEADQVIELDVSELSDDDVVVELDDFDEFDSEDSLEKEIIEDVDKVFTTMKEESLSDNDLDLIDELNSEGNSEEFEELTELTESESEDLDFSEPIQELDEIIDAEEKDILETKKAVTPNIPVYEADIPSEDTVLSDSIEQGDTVTHAKYGNGVVEKMIKYGNKTLFSINFDNVGRRLLDPTLTEIKKG